MKRTIAFTIPSKKNKIGINLTKANGRRTLKTRNIDEKNKA